MKTIRYLIFAIMLAAVAYSTVSAQDSNVHWAKYDSGKVRYYDVGKRGTKALVLIHGWTCNADFWRESEWAFPQYRVIVLDLPGHGLSDKPHTDYSMEYFARSIDAVLKDAKVKHAVLVGHSMGTPVIRQFYRLFPKETLGLVIVDGALRPYGPKAQMDKFFEPLYQDYSKEAPKFIDGLLGPVRADLKPGIRAAMLATRDYVAISAMKGMIDESIWTEDKIKVPVLAIMADSPEWANDTGSFYKTIAPDIDFQLWPGVSHFLMMEKPKEFNKAVGDFVAKKKLL